MKTLIIDRRKWLRISAPNYVTTSLCDITNKKMCCLGFYLRSLDLSEKDFLDLGMPNETKINKIKLGWLLSNTCGRYNSEHCKDLADINDDNSTNDKSKEEAIAEIFRKHDVKVIFRN